MSRIVITGASTGIGAATALELAPGNTIYIHYYRSADAAREVAEKVEKAGGKAHLVQADLASNEGCEKLAREVAKESDSLDVLVNNAGGLLKRHGLDETT